MPNSPVTPFLLEEVVVISVERLSPTFQRIELGAPALAEFGVDGPLYDQRIKLVFPHAGAGLPSFAGADESWFGAWLERPVEQRGHMRTYTVRAVRGTGAATTLLVDFALHEGGEYGPGSRWAATACPGDRAVLLAPRRGHAYGGIEFAPGDADHLLLAGDETAVPAICAVLGCLTPDAAGAAFLEVPTSADVLDVPTPPDVRVKWLPRDGAPLGERLHDAVVDHLGATASAATPVAAGRGDREHRAGETVWETPTYSGAGEELGRSRPTGSPYPGLYAWIAGESSMVTRLRRHLVRDVGLDRSQVAFMGYWRRGVAMRS